MEVSVDDVKVAQCGVLKSDSHESANVYVVDVFVCDWVEVFEKVLVDKREDACGLFGVVRPKKCKVFWRLPSRNRGIRGVGLLYTENVCVAA